MQGISGHYMNALGDLRTIFILAKYCLMAQANVFELGRFS